MCWEVVASGVRLTPTPSKPEDHTADSSAAIKKENQKNDGDFAGHLGGGVELGGCATLSFSIFAGFGLRKNNPPCLR